MIIGLSLLFRHGPMTPACATDPSDPRLGAALDRLPALIAYWDGDLRSRMTTRAYRELFRLGEGEISGRRMPDLLGDALFAQAERRAAAALRGEPQSFEWELPTPSGPRFLQVAYTPDVLDGRVVGFYDHAFDVTDRALADQRHVQAESRFRTLFVAAPTPTLLLDDGGVITAVNPAAALLLGRTVQELTGMHDLELTHPDDVEESRRRLAALWAGELNRYRIDKRYVHAFGHSIWTQTDGTLIDGVDDGRLYVLKQIQDVTARRAHDQELEYLAGHDVLTGLLNRRGLFTALEREAARARRYGSPAALLVVDLDHFKHVNDTLGHLAGDDLIVTVATLIQSRVRESDIVARLGGDEFAVILPDSDRTAADAVAAQIVQLLRGELGTSPAGELSVTASVGVAMFDPGLLGEEVLVAADLAMYDAKEAGRDRSVHYNRGDAELSGMQARINSLTRVRAALRHGKLTLASQPIVDRSTGHVAMHELLMRLDDGGPELGPAAFLPLAERFDLIQEIDRFAVLEALDLLIHAQHDGRTLCLSVNVSARSVSDSALLDLVEAAVTTLGIRPADLVFELTETAAVTHVHAARAFAQRARELGCRIAIDDFGAGFGSFLYLKHLPFDYLKVDGAFVTGAPENPADALIVRTVRDLARGLGGEVIAEYCANDRVIAWLDAEGIFLQQGFAHGRPRPAAQLNLPTAPRRSSATS